MQSTQVLIIGAGPVGLFSAICLNRLGVACVLAERRLDRLDAPKAHAVNPRTLEICQRFGVPADEVRAAGASAEDGGQVHFVDTLSGSMFGSLPYERQDDGARAYTPWPLVNIPQPVFEDFLSRRLTHCDDVSLLRGVTATALDDTSGAVTTLLEGNGLSEPLKIQSDYVIAADGAASTTRDQLGIKMEGREALQHYIMIHFEADLTEMTSDRPGLLYFTMAPQARGVFIGYQRERCWVYMHAYDPGTETREDYTAERCRRLVEAAAGCDIEPFKVRNLSTWTMSAQIAETYRAGRVFLAGDAAHRFPPTGGLGLNTGIADAHNLCWKLAMVLNGEADAVLLDSYDAERRPIAHINSHQSVKNSNKLKHLFHALYGADRSAIAEHYAAVCQHPGSYPEVAENVERQRPHFDSFNLQLGYRYGSNVDPDDVSISEYTPSFETGDYLPHVALADGSWLLGMLPVDRYCLITGPDADAWLDVTVPVLVESVDFTAQAQSFFEQAGLERNGALLIRPDGHVAGRWSQAPTNAAETIQHQLDNQLKD